MAGAYKNEIRAMIQDRYFFEIPIYRTTKNTFSREYDRALAAHWAEFTKLAGRPREQLSKDLKMHAEQHFWETYGGPWQCNEIVGWLRLFVCDSQIRADLWMSAAKRLRRKSRAQIRFLGDAFEIHCFPEQTSDAILSALREELVLFQRRFRRGRHTLDLECFDNIAPFVNWKELVCLNNKRA